MPSKGTHRIERGVHAAGEDEVLQQPAHLVVGERGDHRGAQAEAAAQPAGHVVLAAAFPDVELPGGADPALARVQPQHHLTQRDGVVTALVRRARNRSLLSAPDASRRRASPPRRSAG